MKTFFIEKGRATDKPTRDFLHINSCRPAIAPDYKYKHYCRIYRPNGRNDYQIILVTEGVYEVTFEKEVIELNVGDCIIYPPGAVQEYKMITDGRFEQTVGFFAHFTGACADEVMAKAGFKDTTVLRAVLPEVKFVFKKLFDAHKRCDQLQETAQLLNIIALLAKNGVTVANEAEKRVRAEAEYINIHFSEKLDFDEMAKRCYLSRSRFTHIFSDLFGQPPTLYQLNQKLNNARELLIYSELSIGEITEQCGFSDQMYFSKVFKKTYDMSPLKYRKLNQ